MNREEKKGEMFVEFHEAFYHIPDEMDNFIVKFLDQAYQYGLQQGKKEAVKDFDKKQKSHSNKPHSSHDWQSALSICWRCVEDGKKEMLEPLSTPKQDG